MDGNQFANRPGPRLIETAELFAAAIHPELFGSSTYTATTDGKLSRVDYVTVQ